MTAGEGGPTIGAAERVHAAHAQAVAAATAPLVAMSADILKAVSFINGGAAVATLLFVTGSLRDHRSLALALVLPLALFGFGLTVAAFATGFTYLAQERSGTALSLQECGWQEPFIRDTAASLAASREAGRFRNLAFGAVLVGMASAVGGFALAGAILWFMLR
ncbi:hypothetical protein [uncultured Enterovirga sp.]|uniref:hypothetical protein n=1 Tax=uncultured Enterovirga sp. TaxID=2026352 RepID=UPI0035CA222C